MATVRFENVSDDPVVTIERGSWNARLEIAGMPVFEFGAGCGTCGVLFSRVAEPATRVTDHEAAELLGDLVTVPRRSVLRKFARLLPSGDYEVGVFPGVPSFVAAGSADHFWQTDIVKLHGSQGWGDYVAAPYYELGQRHENPGSQWGPEFPRRAVQLLIPLFDSTSLDEARVSFWIDAAERGRPLTALSLAVADEQSPAIDTAGSDLTDYPFREHRVLLHYLLDGHHRARAAAALGTELRVLAFVARQYSWTGALGETLQLFAESDGSTG